MKRLFGKQPKPLAPPNSGGLGSPINSPPVIGTASTHTTGLRPKFLVPPIPHPSPHDHLSLLVTKEGLLIRPYTAGLSGSSTSYVRIAWGKTIKVEEIEASRTRNGDHAEWEKGVIVYGIVGLLELFSGALPKLNRALRSVGD
jgi:hypothetical protein